MLFASRAAIAAFTAEARSSFNAVQIRALLLQYGLLHW